MDFPYFFYLKQQRTTSLIKIRIFYFFFFIIYARYLLSTLPYNSGKQSVDKHNKCMLMLILVCGKSKNGPEIVCVFIKKGQNGKN